MNGLIIVLTCAALLVAGLIGITLSVPLQAPAVILLGLAALLAAAQVWKSGSNFVPDGDRYISEGFKPWGGAGKWLLWLCLVSIGYFVVRACLSPVWDLGVEDLMLIVSAGILYLIAGYAVTGKSGILLRQGLAWVVVVLLLLHVGAAVMQLNGGEGYSAAYYFTGVARSSPENVTGMYSYYGSFANFAVIAGLLCLSLGVWGRLSVMLRVMMCLLGLLALGLALWSQSRSAALSLFPALAVFGVLLLVSLAQHSARVRRRSSKVMVSLGVCALLAGGVAAAWVFQNRAHGEQVSGVDVVFDSGVRSQYWAMAAEQWVDFPIVGAGSRSFSYECFRYWSPNLPTQNANPEFVHNEYLQLLADYGLVGLLLILVLLGWHFYRGGKQVRLLAVKIGEGGLKRGSNAMALAIAGISGMTAMAVHICFDFRTHLLANLLLLVCCAVWVLPVAKSTVSLSGGPGAKESKMGSLVLGLVLLAAGLVAVGLGCQQLWAGMPLVKNKMAKEDGAWQPATVNRDIWIPALEESLARAPQWRRYQRLGTLHWHDANVSDEVNETSLRKAEVAYLASLERHASNPIPKINLANIYAQAGRWQEADAMYASAEEMSKAREWWFRLPIQWSKLHQRWAIELWRHGHHDAAKEHYDIALKHLLESKTRNEARRQYVVVLVQYINLNDELGLFEQSDALWDNAQQDLPVYVVNSLSANIRREIGTHYLKKAKSLWYQRKPEEAYEALLDAKQSYHIHEIQLKGKRDAIWRDGYHEVKKILAFFKKTGVGD
jgi:O-antigen ligase/tetratricopeptide (TPR) repeat protein